MTRNVPRKLLVMFLGLMLSVLFTIVGYHDAQEIAAGRTHVFERGRGAGFDHVIYFLARSLGSGGIALVGTAISFLLGAALIREVIEGHSSDVATRARYSIEQILEFKAEYAKRHQRRNLRILLLVPIVLPVLAQWFHLSEQMALAFMAAAFVVFVIADLKDWRCPACNAHFGKRGAVPIGGSASGCPNCQVELV